ncbi:MAG: response regulator, partial [Ignavibacteriales bacterium]|nr:response regulator [Ignavibacteriales bacterium]
GEYIHSMDISQNGDVLTYHESNELRIRRGKIWSALPQLPSRVQNIQDIQYRNNNDIWFGTNNGLFLFRQSSTRWTSQKYNHPDSRNRINEIVKTSSGDIWFGTGSGVEILSSTGKKTSITHVGAFPLNEITGLAEDSEGGIWITSGNSFLGAYRFFNNEWKHFSVTTDSEEIFIHKIRSDKKGRLWFLGLAQNTFALPEKQPGAFVYEKNNFTRWGTNEGLLNGRVYSFAEGKDGAYWFATYGGLSRYLNGDWKHWTRANGLISNRIFSVATDSANTLWFADQHNGIGTIDAESNIRYFTTKDGLVGNNVWEIAVDSSGIVWYTSGEGLGSFYKNTWCKYDVKTGLHNSRLWSLLPLKDKVLVGTMGAGLAALDLKESSQPLPRIIIEMPVTDYEYAFIRWKKFGYWGEPAPLDIYSRFQLDNNEWSDWSTLREVTLKNLSSGNHTFTLQARNLFGDDAGKSSTINFTIPLQWYKRPTYYLTVSSLVLLVLILLISISRRKHKHTKDILDRDARYRELFEESKDVIYISTPEGKLLDINQAGVELFGYSSKQELLLANIERDLYFDPASRSSMQKNIIAKGFTKDFEIMLKRKDGKKLFVLETSSTVRNDRGDIVAYRGIMRDITEQKNLEEQLRQAQKMESIGTLAGGIAHDFNNLLGIIEGYTSLAERSINIPEKITKHLDAIHKSVTRGAKLVRQMLMFARKSDAKLESVNVREIIEDIHKFIEETFPKTITCKLDIEKNLPLFVADGTQIHQAILNLSVNARDAMPNGGTITLSALTVGNEKLQSRFPEAKSTQYICLAVSDTGQGIDEETKNRIFEPFFTTKEKGKGTGLGLSVIYGIMKTHNGFIDVESSIGKGTTFQLYFPYVQSKPIVPEELLLSTEMLRGTEAILIIEDEIMLGESLKTMLEENGYTVLWAKDGIEGVEMYNIHQSDIALIISDMGLPKLNGADAYKQIAAINKNVKVIFASGYLQPDEKQELFDTGIKDFIHKPYDNHTVLKTVREVLNGA